MNLSKSGTEASAATSTGLASPAFVVVLILLLGAVVYLWRSRYIRRKAAYPLIIVLSVALIGLCAWIYLHPVTG